MHGLTLADTRDAPIFPVVWQEIAPHIEGLPLVAHNKAFDESCLKAVFRTYCMDYPDYEFHCTLQASRRVLKGLPNYQLHTVAACCGYQLATAEQLDSFFFCLFLNIQDHPPPDTSGDHPDIFQ